MADEKVTPEEDMSDDDLDQIIQDISKEEEVTAAKPTATVSTLGVLPGGKKTMAGGGSKPEQSLNLELTGVINLKLCFSSGERSIEVLVSEEALICRMADGTEFRIPTGIAKKRVSAA
ncbi:MAG: hypothetical protein ACXWQO_09090 [Bdellovibrionota bacterium]